jgi:hypothetical protein
MISSDNQGTTTEFGNQKKKVFYFFIIIFFIPSGRIFFILDFLFGYCFLRWDFGFVVVLHICLCS